MEFSTLHRSDDQQLLLNAIAANELLTTFVEQESARNRDEYYFCNYGHASGGHALDVYPEFQIHYQQSTNYVKVLLDQLSQADEYVGIADIIGRLKLNLGLSTKDIASILQVSRQTLYSYQKTADSDRTMNESTKDRAMQLHTIVNELRDTLSKSPGALAKNVTVRGSSLFDLLSAAEFDRQAILAITSELRKRMECPEARTSGKAEKQSLLNLTRSV